MHEGCKMNKKMKLKRKTKKSQKNATQHKHDNDTSVRTYVIHVRNICHIELVNSLTKHTLLIIR